MRKILLSALFLSGMSAAQWVHKDISSATFAKNIENRTPIEAISEAENDLRTVYFFTNIRHLKGEKITHRWHYKNKVKAEVSFDIKGNRWRVWSSKNLWHKWTGIWTVEVLNRAGEVLITKNFTYKDKK
jgi:hypothetical protein